MLLGRALCWLGVLGDSASRNDSDIMRPPTVSASQADIRSISVISSFLEVNCGAQIGSKLRK